MKPAIDINRILKLNLFDSKEREEWMQAQDDVLCGALDSLRNGDIREANANLDTLDQLLRHPKAVEFQETVDRFSDKRKQVLAFEDKSSDFELLERVYPGNANISTKDNEQ